MAISAPQVENSPDSEAQEQESPQLFARYAHLAALLALTLLALALRGYDLVVMGCNPDNYEQLEATQRLLRADLPLSTIYPPGIPIIMAPFFALLPDSLGTMQLVIVAAGVALCPATYALTLRASGDSRVALLAALLVTVSTTFVNYSRDGHFDSVYAVFFVLALLATPRLERRGVVFIAGYGALVALLANFRQTNVAIVPALLLIWSEALDAPFDLRMLLRERVFTRVLIAPAVFVALMAASVLFSGWFGQPAASPTLESYGQHLLSYGYILVYGLPGLVLLLPLALLGWRRMWHANRSLAVAMAYIIVAWPLLFAVFVFTEARYMLPPLLCVLILVACGASTIWRTLPPASIGARAMRLYLPAAALFFLVVFMAFTTVVILGDWRESAEGSDEGMFRSMRPAVAAIGDDALLVSAMTQGLRGTGSFERMDLIQYYLRNGSEDAGVQALVEVVAQTLSEGRPVYYLYSRFEAGADLEGEGREGFQNYFDALEARFEVRVIYVSERYSFGTHWILHELSEAPSAGR